MGSTKKKERRKTKTLNVILGIVATFLFAFIGLMCWFFYKFQQVPDILITCVLGTGTAELIATAIITIVKKKYGAE